jgi:hypothetical protein
VASNKWQVASGGALAQIPNFKIPNPKKIPNPEIPNSKNVRDAEAAGALIPAF